MSKGVVSKGIVSQGWAKLGQCRARRGPARTVGCQYASPECSCYVLISTKASRAGGRAMKVRARVRSLPCLK
ncbi:hypothetical protein KHC19_12625 [Ancylobacter oerskovii]|nr:hypothetical protein [Ancylobacter oerskovii]